ncbi:MAG TPA: Rieske (2Fe-2S) protein [Bryobacteraceae bacterium]|nr:Rieske (2Fe-2S) protein [Bryobacteraceae bacterium]
MDQDGRQGCCGCEKSREALAGGAVASPNSEQSRRSLLSWLVGGGVAASLISFLYPVIRFLNPPHVTEAAVDEVSGGKVADLKPNSGKIVRFGSKPALLVRVSDIEWKAFSAVCTHLNCTVQYQETTHQIWCACHNGTYDLMTGRVVSGPPPKPLEEFAVRVRGDEVVISRRA